MMFIDFYIARPTYCFILVYTCGLTVVIKRIMLRYVRDSIVYKISWQTAASMPHRLICVVFIFGLHYTALVHHKM